MKRTSERGDDGWLSTYEGRQVLKVNQILPGRGSAVIMLRGTANGAGKSTIPMRLLSSLEYFYITTEKEDKRPVATYIPTIRLMIIGTYLPGTNCGGCDTISDVKKVYQVISALWDTATNILFEGVIVGDNKQQTYLALKRLIAEKGSRDIYFILVNTPLEECLKRIQKRNNGKVIKQELVEGKFKAQQRYWAYLKSLPDVTCFELENLSSPESLVMNFYNFYVSSRHILQ